MSPRVQANLGYFQGAWNSMTDLVLTFIPFVIIRRLNMKLSTRVALSIIMGMSVFAMIACIVKTVEVRNIAERMDLTWDSSYFVIWSTLESYVLITVASISALRPLALHCMKVMAKASRQGNGRTSSQKGLTASDSSSRHQPQTIPLATWQNQDTMEAGCTGADASRTGSPSAGMIHKTVSFYIYTEERSEAQQEVGRFEEWQGRDRPGMHRSVSHRSG